MKPQKLIFKLPKDKPPFVGVVFADNNTAIIAQHLLRDIGKYTLTVRLARYPHMTLSRPSNKPYDHGSSINYKYVTFEVNDLNEFADKAFGSLKTNLGHVFYDEIGNLQIARTADKKPFVIPLVKFDLFDPDKHYGTHGI